MKKKEPLHMVGIRIKPDVKKSLGHLAVEDGKSFSAYVSNVLEKHTATNPKAKKYA